jgi:hypothetical protein
MSFAQFVKNNYDLVRDLPAKERMKELSMMYKENKENSPSIKKSMMQPKKQSIKKSMKQKAGAYTAGGFDMSSIPKSKGGDFEDILDGAKKVAETASSFLPFLPLIL